MRVIQSALPEQVLIDADEHTYTIYDGYPKAQFHFLVLPRLPFYCDEVLENGKRKRIQIPTRELDSISSVLASRHASFILECLQRASDRVRGRLTQLVARIRKGMRQLVIPPEHPQDCDYAQDGEAAQGVEWDIRCGFHSIPSMRHVHLHVGRILTQVVSGELVSERMKHKKVRAWLMQHYLSFHPRAGYWLPLSEAQRMASEGVRTLPHPRSYYENLLKGPLLDLDTEQTFKTFPLLKKHLEQRWVRAVEAQAQELHK